MKILAVLISLLVLSLNGIPCCADDCADDNSIEQRETNSHSKEACSPFLSCGTCSAVVFQEELLRTVFSEPITSKQFSEAETGLFSEFSLRIWQPPKDGRSTS